MPAGYAALPNHRSAKDTEREMNDAFESDDDDDDHNDDQESTPLTRQTDRSRRPQSIVVDAGHTTAIPSGVYDFERDYDVPPPGSPPLPSSVALPNDYGNSNGLPPSSPVRPPSNRPSFFRRTVGAILPTHYTRLPTESRRTRAVGGGIENDGVFGNVTAKPTRPRAVQSANGEVHMVPEDTQKEAPPSYNEAQADSVPPYWETTVHAPGLDLGSDMIIEDLPSGSFFIFVSNLFVSFFFQFVGFALTYVLHTSHAAKFGSRAGLGLTLIQYGFYSRTSQVAGDGELDAGTNETETWPAAPTESTAPSADAPADSTAFRGVLGGVTSREWLSFLLMTLGWFLLLSSCIGFWRIKRWESSIRASSTPAPQTREEIDHHIAIRRNMEQIFGLSRTDVEEEDRREAAAREEREELRAQLAGNPEALLALQREEQLENDLRAAGLI